MSPMKPMILSMLLFAGASTQAAPLALTGATLVDGTGSDPVENAVVIVDGDRIACAGTRETCPPGEDMRRVELEGRYITPGLVDAHVHYSQTGWADGRPDSLDVRDRHPYPAVIASLEANPGRWHRSYLCSGVTAVFDVGGYPWTWNVRQGAETHQAPHYAAAGPLLTTRDHWVNLPAERQFIYLEDEGAAKEGVAYLDANDTDAVKLWFIVSGDRPFDELSTLATAAGRQSEEAGLPFIVHATGLREARVAIDAGAHMLVHSVTDKAVDRAFVEAATAGDVFYTPTLTVSDGYYRMYASARSGKAPEFDDPNHCVDSDTLAKLRETATLGERLQGDGSGLDRFRERLDREREIMAANLVELHEAGVTIVTGSDAGNPMTLHGPAIYAEMESMQAAGLTPMEVIVASTRNGARAMGRGDEFGTIEQGKIADLLVLESDPTEDVAHFRKLEYVMRAGTLMKQSQLRASR